MRSWPTSRPARERCAASWPSAPGAVPAPDASCAGGNPYPRAPTMPLSLNDRAHELADGLAAEADALRAAVTTLPNGTRVIDCGSAAPGGLEAGRRFAEICMG